MGDLVFTKTVVNGVPWFGISNYLEISEEFDTKLYYDSDAWIVTPDDCMILKSKSKKQLQLMLSEISDSAREMCCEE